MSNYYMEFCVTIQRVSKEEAAWLSQKLKEMKEKAGLTFGFERKGTSLCLHGDERLDGLAAQVDGPIKAATEI